jgi:hypothetical protein
MLAKIGYETLMGLYEKVKFSKKSKESTDFHDNKEHPQHYLQRDGHT